MRLILIRHGQTSSNVSGLLDSAEPGADLTDLGREQAAAVPASLVEESIDAVYVSNLVRTQQTAEPLLTQRAMEAQIRPGLREIEAGDLEMRSDADAHEAYLATIFGWAQDPHLRMPGAQSGQEVWDRYDEVIAEAHASGAQTVVMFSHGAIMRSWAAARVPNVSSEHAARNPITNTGAIILNGDPSGGWWARTWEGMALGGDRVSSPAADGPAGEEPPEQVIPGRS